MTRYHERYAMNAEKPNHVPNPWLQKIRSFWRHTIRQWLDRHYWAALGVMWGVAFCLGYWGWVKHFRALGEYRTFQDILYLTLQLFTVESGAVTQAVGWQLDMARFLAPATTLYAAIAALTLIFRDQLQMMRVRLLRDHAVICGLGRRGLLLAEEFLARGVPVVAIERDTDSDWIIPCREQGGVVVYGDACNKEVLRGAGAPRADCVIAVCGEGRHKRGNSRQLSRPGQKQSNQAAQMRCPDRRPRPVPSAQGTGILNG